MQHAGWRSRGYLPHCDAAGLVQHIVLGLADALPRDPPAGLDVQERLTWAEREFDVGYGARLLAEPDHALIVQNCLLQDDGARYALAARCIMPNHVHIVAEQFASHALADIVQTWKSVSAHRINKAAGRKGALWRREYFDRFMRSEQQYANAVTYVEDNPVAAGLTSDAADWRFSSAWRGWRHAGEGAGGPG